MNWPNQLINDVACRRAVLFFGAGISMNSVATDGTTRPKGWVQFLQDATTRIPEAKKALRSEVKTLINKNDLLTACELVRRSIGRDDFVQLVKQEFQVPGFTPAPIHDLLWKLDLRITVTPNFDNIYDSVIVQKGCGTVSIKNYSDVDIADGLRRHERVLIKNHGSVTTPDEIIFTRIDYAKARNKHRHFYELIDSLLRTYTFIFIGCGLDDPDIRMLLEDYCFRHEFAQKHYFVIPDRRVSMELKGIYEESLKIKFVEYKYTSDHNNLTVGLQNLVSAVELKRIEIGKEQGW